MIAACDAVGTVTEETSNDESETPSDDPSTATVVNHYAGPGSRLDVKLKDDNTFTFTARDSVGGDVMQTVWGTYERLPSGFLTMTADSSEGEDAPAPGDEAYGFDIPGFAFVLHPRDQEHAQMHVMVSAGACPTAPTDGNWIMVHDAEHVPATDPEGGFFGTFYYDPSRNFAKIPALYSLAEFANLGGTEPTQEAVCENGIIDLPEADMYLTESGIMALRLHTGDEGFSKYVFGVPNEQTESVEALDGEYAGLLFNSSPEGREVTPVHTACEGGTCTGTEVTDVESGTEAAEGGATITLHAPNELEPGIITGTIANSAKQETTDGEQTTSKIACTASTKVLDTDRKILSCVGMSPDNPEQAFSVLMTSIDG